MTMEDIAARYEAQLAEMQAKLEAMEQRVAQAEDLSISELEREIRALEQEYDVPVPGQQLSEPCSHVYPDGRVCHAPRGAHLPAGPAQPAKVRDHSYRNQPLKSGGAAPAGFYARQDIPETIPDAPDLDRIKAELLEQLRAELTAKPEGAP